jgi:hypothetical protein
LLALAQHNEKSGFIGEKLTDICKSIIGKKTQYFLVAPTGVVAKKTIDRGDVYEKDISLSVDDVLIDTKYRIVVNRIGLTSPDAPDFHFVEVNPTCPRTSEFQLVYAPSTKSSGFGKQDDDLQLSIEGPDQDIQFKADYKFLANIFSPKIDWLESSSIDIARNLKELSSPEATEFFQGKRGRFVLKLSNSGNAPLIVTDLTRKSANSRWYAIDAKSCHSPSVAPQGTCDIVFTRLANPQSEAELTDDLDIQSNYKMGYPGFGIHWSTKKTVIDFASY